MLCGPAPKALADPRWELGGELLALSAPVLPGVVLGASVDAHRDLFGPFHAGLRLGGGTTSDDNEFWNVAQTHLLATAGFGVSRVWDAARLSADLEAGVMLLREDAIRHQFGRLIAANITDRERLSTTAGPIAALRFAVAVEFAEHWSFRISAGPEATYLVTNDAWKLRGGVFTGAGVVHAF